MRPSVTASHGDVALTRFDLIARGSKCRVNPFDLIPDVLLIAGYLDDATVVGYTLRRAKDALDAFMQWEASQKSKSA